MREIKFRVWDNKNKYFLNINEDPDYTLEFTNNGGLFLRDNGTVLKDVIFLQFTGLKDKNGKEIYEGDVIKWVAGKHWDAYGGDTKNARIETVRYESYGYYPFIYNEGYGGVITISYGDCIAIGNIYENPELLK